MRRIAVIFGSIFVALGFLGFIPGVTTFAPDVEHGRLFGVLAVNTAHNMLHVITGAVAIWVGVTSPQASRNYFRVVGILYAVLAFLGFGYGNAPLLGMAHNLADAAFHAIVALLALFFGFGRQVERLGGPGSRHAA